MNANDESDWNNLIPLEEFRAKRRISNSTVYRYRQRGFLVTIEVFGKIYLSRDAIDSFDRRAAAGEFRASSRFDSRAR